MTGFLIGEGRERILTQRNIGKGHVKVQADNGG